MDINISPTIQIKDEELQFSFARSGGPGGQNVNKVNSKAVLRFALTLSANLPADVKERFVEKYGARLTTEGELILTSQRYRDQAANVEDCLQKLKEMILSVATKPVARKKTRPSLAAQRRRVESKRETAIKKQQRRAPLSYD
jgi:ribosome-associated protein